MPPALPGSERAELFARVRELEAELSECRETLEAIQNGEIDAVVVSVPGRERRVYTLETADRPYRFLIEQMQEGAATIGADGTVLYCNRPAAALLGVPQGSLIGQDLRRYLAPGDAGWLTRLLGQSDPVGARAEVALRAMGGAEVPVQLSVSPLLNEDTGLFCAMLTDLREQKQHLHQIANANERLLGEIAERERTEEVLRQAQKMQAVGQLTGGIAHDFNNMLQGIASGVDFARRRIALGHAEQADRYLGIARQSLDRAAALTHRLLAFSRRQMHAPQRIDINQLLRGVATLVRQAIGPEIELKLRLKDGCWPVRCDANQLESALLNLAINARDAMLPTGGTLLIETEHAVLGERDLVAWSGAHPGEFVRITVTDTGTGMSPEVLAHVFEPFFTTKPVGVGTGLGLSQVYGFVAQSGGVVRVDSVLGRGTSAHVYLPGDRMPAVEDASVAAGAGPESARAALARVLLVDDEEAVRRLMAEALREVGCVVTEAKNGPAALEALGRMPGRIDVLVTDVGLPGGMNGRQLAEAARDRLPSLPVLLITGYTADALEQQSLPRGTEVLRKPFSLDVLAASMRRVLSRQPSVS